MAVNGVPPVVMVALSLFPLLSMLILCCACTPVPSILLHILASEWRALPTRERVSSSAELSRHLQMKNWVRPSRDAGSIGHRRLEAGAFDHFISRQRKLMYNSGEALQEDDEQFNRSMSSRNLIVLTNTSTSTSIELTALLAFRSSIHTDLYDPLVNWTIENGSNRCLTWTGVTCNPMGQVIGIHLSANYLQGNITPMIGDLVHLSSLNLSANMLWGPIPSELSKCYNLTLIDLSRNFELDGEIPAELLSLPKLEKLWLSYNKFSGPVPGVVGNSCGQALTTVWVDGNRLSGSIPSSLGTCHNLKSLKMGANRLNGSIPATLGELEQLEELRLDDNQISGGVPRELGSLKKLQELSLNGNRLMGSIPAELGNLTSLSILDLSSNPLNGTIPDSLGRCSNLRGLYLSSNGLTGQIPTQLGWLKKLEQLDLGSNLLVGNVPPSLGALSQLSSLQLRMNRLTGSIPPSLGNCSFLSSLDMMFNSLTGSIPPSLGNCTSLRYLDMGFNSLTGTIPEEFGNMTSLQHLKLEFNNLAGTIPQRLGECKSLRTVDLSGNSFTGDVPALSNPQLYSLDLSNNQLNGSALPLSSLYQCRDLEHVRLANNNIRGPLQLNFSEWFNLAHFSVSRNNLIGNIPSFESIRSRRLGVLDFSRNGFTGTIPPYLPLPSSVSIFNVSLNNLSGEIPTDFGFGTFRESSYLPGNPGLCGDVIHRPCHAPFQPSSQPNAPVHTVHEVEEMISDFMSIWAFGVGAAMGFVAVLVTSIAWAPARHFVYGSPKKPKVDQPYGSFNFRT